MRKSIRIEDNLTVGDLKQILSELPDDMDIIVGHDLNNCFDISSIVIGQHVIGFMESED